MFDVVFISYDEPNADENWERLLEVAPHAIRVDGVKGIPNAHIEAASQVSTSHFFTVDGDNVIDEDFDWEKIVDFRKNDQRIHVWRARNAVNNLVYGYGGIKLWPTEHVENIKENSVDFTTSVATHGFKVQSNIASTTVFNSNPYHAWRGGYRECLKLASGIIHNPDPRSMNRLKVWTTVGIDAEYGEECLVGARSGALQGFLGENLNIINDFEKLHIWYIRDLAQDPEYYSDKLKKYGFEIPTFDVKQSKLIKEIMGNI